MPSAHTITQTLYELGEASLLALLLSELHLTLTEAVQALKDAKTHKPLCWTGGETR